MSKQRTAQALAELFGTPVSEGTVAAMSEHAAGGLAEFVDDLRVCERYARPAQACRLLSLIHI